MKKTVKVLALAGALSVGALSGAHAQALTSATTVAAERPILVGIGGVLGVVHVSSTVATSLTLAIPDAGRLLTNPQCVAYDSTFQGPKPLRYTFNQATATLAVTSSNMTSGTLAVGDQVLCHAVYRP